MGEVTSTVEEHQDIVSVTVPDTQPDDHSYHSHCVCGPVCTCIGCADKQQHVNRLQNEVEELKEQIHGMKERKNSENTRMTNKALQNDRKVKLYTGLPNKSAFENMYEHLLPRAKQLNYWNGAAKVRKQAKRKFHSPPKKFGPKRQLTVKDEMTMTLMKLRLALTSELLGDLFGVSISVVSQVINTWLKFLAHELKPLIYWPPKEDIQATLPDVYQAFSPRLRCVIDCTEVPIERPRDLELQAQTWSDYKKHNTLKILVAIAPNGSITFVSVPYGGRASDRHIVQDSGFLEKISPTDQVMADRGFPIQSDLVMRQASLIIPPPAQGTEQMTKENVLKTKSVANLRIHVERAIGRIKWFHIMKQTMPLTLVPLANEIVTICAALCNLSPPLVT